VKLKDKVALVTGGSGAIGRSICLAFAEEGAQLVVNYSRSKDKAEAVVARIKDMGGEAISCQADVAREEKVSAMFQKIIDTFSRLDILVNNAGIVKDSLLVRMSGEDWDKVLNINLKGAFNCLKLAAKIMMKQRSGRIINISSIVGERGNPGQANYSSAKAGMIGLTKTAAQELAKRGITVNAIAPGYIISDMTAGLPDKVKEMMLNSIPLGRYGNPKDVANLALFLASEEASYITGQTINVDGGMIMQ
jgi:3-oxoacyl-[acyl-carrier protein] reductase